MLKVLWLLAASCLCSCTPVQPAARKPLVAFADSACPATVTSQYHVSAALGADYTICTLEPVVAGAPRAEIRVGGIWGVRDRTLFAGFSNSAVGQVAWFLSPPAAPGSPEELWAYVPTGLGHPQAVLLVIYQARPSHVDAFKDFLLGAMIKASMRPNNSSKPTPLRGAA